MRSFSDTSRLFKLSVLLASGLLIVMLALSFYWSREPDRLSVFEQHSTPIKSVEVVGSSTVSTMVTMINVLLDKPGGFLSNDVMPPSVFLDNMPNWERGVIVQVRDMARALRDGISRSQSQSTEDPDLAITEARLNIEPSSWMLPNAQTEYREAAKHLNRYLVRLSDDDLTDAQFYARADNLAAWLFIVEARLGSLSQRLSASVGQKRVNTDLAGDAQAQQSTQSSVEVIAKTSWWQIDDVFYEARGSAWALSLLLQSVKKDFAPILKTKNAEVSLAQIIRELEGSLQPLHSPFILNGSGFGLFANHSLVMASYLSRANAAIIDLRRLLENG